MKWPYSTGRNKRCGAAAVEFAFVAPVLVTLILGIIEFGRVLMVEQILVNAARAGCRVATLAGSVSSDVTNTVSTYTTNAGVSGASCTTSPDPSKANPGDAITVTVTVPFNNVSWLATPIYMGGATLTATVVMRKEASSQ